MRFSLATLSLLSGLALASPVPDSSISMMANAPQWTIESFTRTCNSGNTSCSFSYSIDTHSGSPTKCAYTITGKSVSVSNYGGVKCGAYTVSSGWSGQFGAGNGFTTLAVTNQKQIIYPAYTDKQLVNGKKVSPDQSYAPQNLP